MKTAFAQASLRVIVVIAALLAALQSSVYADEARYGRYAPSRYSGEVVLVDWNSEEGRARLMRATAAGTANDYYQLAHHFQPQQNLLYCGIASSVIVLNALRAGRQAIPSQLPLEIRIPERFGGGRIPYPLYAQATYLDATTERVKAREVVEFQAAASSGKPDPGLMLQELSRMLEAHGAQVQVRHADLDESAGTAKLRADLLAVFADSTHFIIANYDSKSIGQAGYGHISPLAAYDAASDSVLLMDVSGHLNPWLWVPLRDLYLAMHTLDGASYRGYVIVAER